MKRNRLKSISGSIGFLLLILCFLLGFTNQATLGWIVLSMSTIIIAYAIFTGDQPFLSK